MSAGAAKGTDVRIRTRLTIAVVVVLALTLGLLGLGLVRSTRAALVDQVDEQVQDNATRANRPGGRAKDSPSAPERGAPKPGAEPTDRYDYERPVAHLLFSADGDVEVSEPCGFVDDPQPLPAVPDLPSPQADAMIDRIVTVAAVDGSFDYRMLLQRAGGGGWTVTAAPLSDVDAVTTRLIRILVVLGATALAVAALASWALIRSGLRPVDRMIDTAAAIAAGDLSRRVPDADQHTELGRLGRALNEMLVQIEQAVLARAASEDRLRRFVADAAHELRTPLTSLRGYAELYRQGALPDEASLANAMGRIESEGSRMSRLVDELLLLARLDQQRGLDAKPVDVVHVVQEAIDDARVIDPDRPLTRTLADAAVVRGDRVRLRQILDNLLTNARIHTPPGTPIHVSVARRDDHVEISVADRGPGIPADQQARVFERFWRADPSRTRGSGGTGLGLAIVASLVHAHAGTIEIASEIGNGATFTIRLPLDGQPRSTPPPVEAKPAPSLPAPPARLTRLGE